MGHERLHHNISRLHGFEPLSVEGQLPEALRGTLYRTGPGLPERFGVPVRHPFLADGVMSAVRFEGDQALGATRPVESATFLEEARVGHRLYGQGAPLTRRFMNLVLRRSKTTGNTSMFRLGERLFALMENARPLEIDQETLETLEETDFDGVLGPRFSAHPHRMETLKTTFNFGIRWGRKSFLDVYALPDAGPAKRLTEVELPWGSFIHDFAVTESHLVFLCPPARVRPLHATLGIGSFADWFEWVPELGTRAIVVPLGAPERVTELELPPFWFFHVGATGAHRDALVVDVVASETMAVVGTLGTERHAPPPIYTRFVLYPQDGRYERAALYDAGCEFPRVHPAYEGRGPRTCWVATRAGGIARLDLDGAPPDVFAPDEDWKTAEPNMVPSVPPGEAGDRDERAGYVLSLAHHGGRDESALLVFDARDLAAGPLAKVWWGQTVPTTYHGCFVPAE